jgi:hypothetical protein
MSNKFLASNSTIRTDQPDGITPRPDWMRELDSLLLRWCSIESCLDDILEGLKEELDSEYEDVRNEASGKISRILVWRLPPRSPGQNEAAIGERRKLEERKLIEAGYLQEQAQKIASGMSGLGRKRGRPKELGPFAVRALTLSLTTGKTDRQITEKLRGPCQDRQCVWFCNICRDVKRPKDKPSGLKPREPRASCGECGCTIRPEGKKERVCEWCVRAMKAAVSELKKFLKEESAFPMLTSYGQLAKGTPRKTARSR